MASGSGETPRTGHQSLLRETSGRGGRGRADEPEEGRSLPEGTGTHMDQTSILGPYFFRASSSGAA